MRDGGKEVKRMCLKLRGRRALVPPPTQEEEKRRGGRFSSCRAMATGKLATFYFDAAGFDAVGLAVEKLSLAASAPRKEGEREAVATTRFRF